MKFPERHAVVNSCLIVAICVTGMVIAYFQGQHVTGALLGIGAVLNLAAMLRQ